MQEIRKEYKQVPCKSSTGRIKLFQLEFNEKAEKQNAMQGKAVYFHSNKILASTAKTESYTRIAQYKCAKNLQYNFKRLMKDKERESTNALQQSFAHCDRLSDTN